MQALVAGGDIRFRVRCTERPKAGATATLPAQTFIERFLSHVLPTGFKRMRHYGLLASRHKAQKLAACRVLLNQPAPKPAIIESVAQFMQRVAGIEINRCGHCHHGSIRVIAALAPVRAGSMLPRSTGPPP